MRPPDTGPPEKEAGPHGEGPAAEQSPTTSTPDSATSRQVSWWSVHEYAASALNEVGSWPMVGTPTWCDLDDDDPRKLASIFDASRHWALRVETCQQAMSDAGSEISAAADWSAIAQEYRDIAEFYASHPWLKRVIA